MKKWLACLLMASLLLCSLPAMAEEACQAAFTWTADAAELGEFLSMLTDMDQESLTTLSAGVSKLLEDARLEIGVQDDGGFWASLTLKGEELLSMLYGRLTSDEAGYVCSLMPGYVLTVPLPSRAELEQIDLALAEMDWDALLDECGQELDAWIASLPHVKETGSFMGDAYEGGTYRESYRFDDRDVALLLEGIALRVEGVLPDAVTAYEGFSMPLKEFRDFNHQAALRNRYAYLLRLVEDDEGRKIGCSLIVLEDDAQLMTLSLGGGENQLRLVLGTGCQNMNDYIEVSLEELERTDDQADYAAHVSVYQDARRAGLYDAKTNAQGLVISADCLASAAFGDDGISWSMNTAFTMGEAGRSLRQEIAGTYMREPFGIRQEANVYLSDGEAPLLSEVITVEPADARTPETDGLQSIRIDEGDLDALDDLSEVVIDAAETMGLMVFKLIPPELITFLMNLDF